MCFEKVLKKEAKMNPHWDSGSVCNSSAGIVWAHFKEEILQSDLRGGSAGRLRDLLIVLVFFDPLSHVIVANSILELFCELITAWADYSLSAIEKDTDARVQSAVTKWLANTQKRHESAWDVARMTGWTYTVCPERLQRYRNYFTWVGMVQPTDS